MNLLERTKEMMRIYNYEPDSITELLQTNTAIINEWLEDLKHDGSKDISESKIEYICEIIEDTITNAVSQGLRIGIEMSIKEMQEDD